MITNSKLLVLIVFLMIFMGCQKEVIEVINPPPKDVITAQSAVVDLIKKTTLKDGSFDNILDRASCTSVMLPVTVIVDSMVIEIDSVEDFEIIEAIYDEFASDTDELFFIFPIHIILADHSELTINNEDQLEDIIKDCIEDGADDDIECVDFVYPIIARVFDTNNQLAEVITISNDKQWYEFLSALNDETLVGIGFPISLALFDGTELSAADNDELETILEANGITCDEDDDNDFDDDDDPADPALAAVLLNGEWRINSFVRNSIDETTDFAGFAFTFIANGTAEADNGITQISGTWEIQTEDDGGRELILQFGGSDPFVWLEDDWDVKEFNDSMISLMDEDTPAGSNRLLTFEKL